MHKGSLLSGLLLLAVSLHSSAQDSTLHRQMPKVVSYNVSMIDPVYGIEIYEPLNYQLGGDSVRNKDGYGCEAWVEDFYESGELLHKGFYHEGRLKVYKNFYPNGKLEREFKNLDNFRTLMRKYYKDGTLKSEVKYVDGTPIKWSDYYESGDLEYFEEYHRSFAYHLAKKSYYKNGSPSDIFEIVNKKKLEFSERSYYETNKLKSDGIVKYDKEALDFYKTGTWSFYDENGKLTREETYNRGTLVKEKAY